MGTAYRFTVYLSVRGCFDPYQKDLGDFSLNFPLVEIN